MEWNDESQPTWLLQTTKLLFRAIIELKCDYSSDIE